MTETDRESVERLAERLDAYKLLVGRDTLICPAATLRALRSALTAAEAERDRLRDTTAELRALRVEYNALVRERDAAEARAKAADEREADDTARLDYLDTCNIRFNQRNGTRYGWKLDWNHNRIALTDCNFPPLTVREAIDVSRLKTPPNIRAAIAKNDEIGSLNTENTRLREALEDIAAPAAMAMDSADRVEAFRDIARAALKGDDHA